jgi:hypothetical protein
VEYSLAFFTTGLILGYLLKSYQTQRKAEVEQRKKTIGFRGDVDER